MRWVRRARGPLPRIPRKKRAADFDKAVAEFFVRRALEEAAKGRGRTHPEPLCGAVLVKAGRILARAHQVSPTGGHAALRAVELAGVKARGADLYTTLEPCDGDGRGNVPSCAQALLEAGVRRVLCAAADPSPRARGRGLARLRRAGVEVVTGVLAAEAEAQNLPYLKFLRTGLPWVTLKAASTLDGKLATSTGDSRWVTGPEAREEVHRLRDVADVVLVGVGTALADDPALTTRLPGGGGRDALRVVVDSRLRSAPKLRLFQQRSPARTVVATLASERSRKAKALGATGADVWTLPADREGRVDLRALLERLGAEGRLHVMVEGGAELFASFVEAGLADELWLFLAPKLLGAEGRSWVGALGVTKMADAWSLGDVQLDRFGPDLRVRARFVPR